MKKILALMMILMMLSALTLTSGAANTKQEEPPVNFDAVVKAVSYTHLTLTTTSRV